MTLDSDRNEVVNELGDPENPLMNMDSDIGMKNRIQAQIDELDVRARIRPDIEDARETIDQVKVDGSRHDILFLFLVIPAVLLGVEGMIRSDFWIFAEYNRAYFRFPLTVDSFWSLPVIWKAFISSYGHDTFHPHLTGTLFMYIISMIALYPLSILADRKREFHLLTGFCLLAVPFIVSYQSLQNPMGRTAIGFSGVVGAFLGALPVMLLTAVGGQTDLEFVPLWSAGPIFLILAGLAYMAGTSLTVIGLSVGMALVICALTVFYLGLNDLGEGLYHMMWPSNPFSWWGVAVAIAGPYALFFAISARTNIVGHLAGYFTGYVFALLVAWEAPDITDGEGWFNEFKPESRSSRWLTAIALIIVITLIGAVLIGVYLGLLKVKTAQLLISSILAAATFGYVLLTFRMASAMEEEMEHSKEVFKLRRKSDIIDIIKEEVDPLLNELWSHHDKFRGQTTMHASDVWTDGNDTYDRLPALETDFDRATDAALLSQDVDVNRGRVSQYYHSLNQYRDLYDRAVNDLAIAILNDDSNDTDDYQRAQQHARSALALEPIEITRGEWDMIQNDVIPLRDEIAGQTSELRELKRELKDNGPELRQELGSAKSELMEEFYISRTDL